MAGFANTLDQLDASQRLLHGCWRQTSESWRDGVAQEFESQVIEPLDAQTQRVFQGLSQLAELVGRAQRELG
jgi:hypothetical protein